MHLVNLQGWSTRPSYSSISAPRLLGVPRSRVPVVSSHKRARHHFRQASQPVCTIDQLSEDLPFLCIYTYWNGKSSVYIYIYIATLFSPGLHLTQEAKRSPCRKETLPYKSNGLLWLHCASNTVYADPLLFCWEPGISEYAWLEPLGSKSVNCPLENTLPVFSAHHWRNRGVPLWQDAQRPRPRLLLPLSVHLFLSLVWFCIFFPSDHKCQPQFKYMLGSINSSNQRIRG